MIKLRRFLAMYVDFEIIVIIDVSVVQLIMFGYHDSNILMQVISLLLCLIIFFLCIIQKDTIFKNASIGKKIFGLRIFYMNGDIPDRKVIVDRIKSSLSVLFPLQIINILVNNQTDGDKKCNTIVADKNFKIKD